MLLVIAVNSQYSNMKNRLLRQQIEIWIATCSEQTANQNTNIAWQYCKVARKRTTGFTVSAAMRLKHAPLSAQLVISFSASWFLQFNYICRQYSDEHYIFHHNLFNLFLHRPKNRSGGIKCGCIQLALYNCTSPWTVCNHNNTNEMSESFKNIN